MRDKVLSEWMAANEPSNRARKYRDEIVFLRNEGYSFEQITLYLEEVREVKTTRQTVSSIFREESEVQGATGKPVKWHRSGDQVESGKKSGSVFDRLDNLGGGAD